MTSMVLKTAAALALAAAAAGAQESGGTLPETLDAFVELGLIHPGPSVRAEAPRDLLPQPEAMRSAFPAGTVGTGDANAGELACGETACDIAVPIDMTQPDPERLAAIERWAAEASPCPFSVAVPAPGDAEAAVRVRIDCGN